MNKVIKKHEQTVGQRFFPKSRFFPGFITACSPVAIDDFVAAYTADRYQMVCIWDSLEVPY